MRKICTGGSATELKTTLNHTPEKIPKIPDWWADSDHKNSVYRCKLCRGYWPCEGAKTDALKNALVRMNTEWTATDKAHFDIYAEFKREIAELESMLNAVRIALEFYADPADWELFEVTTGEICGAYEGDHCMAFSKGEDQPSTDAERALELLDEMEKSNED